LTAARVLIASLLCMAEPAAASSGVGSPPSDTLDSIRARGELRWGADAFGGAPYVFQDPMDPNHLIGFEVELADAIARSLNVRARPIEGAWDKLLELLARGDFDVALNGIEVADEKRRVCLLSRPYYAAVERLTVRRGDPAAPRRLEALAGRKVGTLPRERPGSAKRGGGDAWPLALADAATRGGPAGRAHRGPTDDERCDRAPQG